jgi:hypothetical protein
VRRNSIDSVQHGRTRNNKNDRESVAVIVYQPSSKKRIMMSSFKVFLTQLFSFFKKRCERNDSSSGTQLKMFLSSSDKIKALAKMASTIWLVTITLIWLTITSIAAEFLRDCHTTDPKPYIYYGTKTPYELINNEDSSPIFAAGKLSSSQNLISSQTIGQQSLIL